MLESRDDPKDRPALRAERIPIEQIPIEQIPVVDFTPFRTGDPAQRKQAAIELAGAFRNVGFAYLAGHGVSQELIDRTFAEAGRFFALPPPKGEEGRGGCGEVQLRPGLVRHRHGEPGPDK